MNIEKREVKRKKRWMNGEKSKMKNVFTDSVTITFIGFI